ncbi:LysR family transcriptional regulator [Tistrella mobilis]|uniref:LysR family transcriptional regulator n=1 Tax=Tistrella mobilis TaxID=171437 RepID=UPI003557825F
MVIGTPMDLRQLKIFCAVVDHGSFTAAAEAVHTVQSNVTMRVKELETELGQPLFIRRRSGVMPTAAGEIFLGYARRILQLTEESRAALQDDGRPIGPLRLGAMETTAAIRLPRLLGSYRARHPEVRMSLTTGTTAELIRAVESCQLDGAFIGGRHQHPALVQEALFDEELALISTSDITSRDALLDTLPDQTVFVFRAGCFYRSTLESWFHQAGLVPGQIMEMGTLDGILSCVASGMGITLLPASVARQSSLADALHCHALPAGVATVTTVFIRRRDTLPGAALKAFMALARATFQPSPLRPPQPADPG